MMVIPIFLTDNKVHFFMSDDEKHVFMREKKQMTVLGASLL